MTSLQHMRRVNSAKVRSSHDIIAREIGKNIDPDVIFGAREGLATATGAHRPSLGRLLRFLAAYGVFAESTPGKFRHTALSAALREGHPESARAQLRRTDDVTGFLRLRGSRAQQARPHGDDQ